MARTGTSVAMEVVSSLSVVCAAVAAVVFVVVFMSFVDLDFFFFFSWCSLFYVPARQRCMVC